MTKATELADALGKLKPDEAWLQGEIKRLNTKQCLPLDHVKKLHDWLNEKRKAKKPCRIVGDSRTGKSIACKAYAHRYRVQQEIGKRLVAPVIWIQIPPKCGSKDLFKEILESLKYRATKGTVTDLRGRTVEVLKGCEVEMLIIDEADRLKPETFAEVRDFYDKLGISVVLVGTDRLDAVIRRDEQVYQRFLPCQRFGKLTGIDFKKTVAIWEQEVLKLPVASNLTSNAMLKVLLRATEGYIGRLDEVLREAAIRSLSQGHKKVEKSVLQEVAREYQ